jgi:hypothetical protein
MGLEFGLGWHAQVACLCCVLFHEGYLLSLDLLLLLRSRWVCQSCVCRVLVMELSSSLAVAREEGRLHRVVIERELSSGRNNTLPPFVCFALCFLL